MNVFEAVFKYFGSILYFLYLKYCEVIPSSKVCQKVVVIDGLSRNIFFQFVHFFLLCVVITGIDFRHILGKLPKIVLKIDN
jgi:hypothetical protein